MPANTQASADTRLATMLSMPRDLQSVPPRPIAPGDVVACYSEDLREWSAAQITDLNPEWKKAGVLELNWSGPEPGAASDLGHVQPLVLTHHAWAGKLAHTNYEWVLPRSYKVIGQLPLLHAGRSDSYAYGWNVGQQLAMQRRWDSGDRETSGRPGELKLSARELGDALADGRLNGIWSLRIDDIERIDCGTIVEALPELRALMLSGTLGHMENAGSLNRLTQLKDLWISNLFGMTKSDCLLPSEVPHLESLGLHSVPKGYGQAMRSTWAPQAAGGCYTDISGLRSEEWLAENLDNPLRDWDGRQQISPAKFRKAVAQYKTTRRAVLAAIKAHESDLESHLRVLGREFGDAFNRLARSDDFIETEEREELFLALMAIPAFAGDVPEAETKQAGEWLAEGLDEVRDW
jgi:hypothetical protein